MRQLLSVPIVWWDFETTQLSLKCFRHCSEVMLVLWAELPLRAAICQAQRQMPARQNLAELPGLRERRA
jgi:hypothetical protein